MTASTPTHQRSATKSRHGVFPSNSGHGSLELKNVNETDNESRAGEEGLRAARRSPAKLWVAVGTAVAVVASAWLAYSYHQSDAAASPPPAALPQVVVSKPLVRAVDSRLGFLGQFSAVEQLEIRAQVGGTLTGIYFKDGDIVQKGDLLFTIDLRPYEIRLAQANAWPTVHTRAVRRHHRQVRQPRTCD